MMPSSRSLNEQSLAISLVELRDAVDLRRILSYQCALLKERQNVDEAVLACKVVNIFEELRFWDAVERVFDSVMVSDRMVEFKLGEVWLTLQLRWS